MFSCDPEVNSKKPDTKIYHICLERLKLVAEECIFIDDKEEHLTPAKELGIHTILYQNPPQLEEDLKKLGVVL